MHQSLSLRRWTLCLVGLLWLVPLASAQTRVAFLGDSITAGQGTGRTPEDVAFARYPAVVARLLGDDFDVRAFGAGGHSLRTDAPLVYAQSKVFQEALEFKPEIAVIMLGTNDSSVDASGGGPAVNSREDLDRLLGPLREASPDVRVLLASPPAMFLSGALMSDERRDVLAARRPLLDSISESLRDLAQELDGPDFVDVRRILREQDVIDGVHLNSFGAERLGYRFAGAIQMKEHVGTTPTAELLAMRPDVKISEFHGFQRYDFSLEQNVENSPSCVLVAPDRIAAGVPWLWRQRSLDNDSSLNRALLDRGVHVAYVEVGDERGAPLAASLDALCRELGLSKYPVIEKSGSEGRPMGLGLRSLLLAAGIHTAESEPTVTSHASAEHRGKAAGWGGGTWRTAFASLQELAVAAESEPPTDVVFLGDSITQGLTGHRKRFAEAGGTRAIDRSAEGRRVVSLGLSGDRTEHLLYRIAEGSLDGFRPRVIVLQIGVNNVNAAKHGGEETYRGIVRVVEALRQRLPESRILITGPFPAGRDPKGRVRQAIEAVHERLAQHSFEEAVSYLDLAPLFVDKNGALRDTMRRDGIHITEAGRDAWMKAIEPTLAQMLDGDRAK